MVWLDVVTYLHHHGGSRNEKNVEGSTLQPAGWRQAQSDPAYGQHAWETGAWGQGGPLFMKRLPTSWDSVTWGSQLLLLELEAAP